MSFSRAFFGLIKLNNFNCGKVNLQIILTPSKKSITQTLSDLCHAQFLVNSRNDCLHAICRVISQLIFLFASLFISRDVRLNILSKEFFLLPCAVLIVEEKEKRQASDVCWMSTSKREWVRAFNEGSLSLFLRSLFVN